MSVRGRVLVTGGAGFLGSHLCERLLAEGYEVVCLDNLLTGVHENIAPLLPDPQFTFVRGDVTAPILLESRVDAVLHFASPASPKDYAQYPIHTLKVGALGTYHSLGLAKAQGASFLLASSSEVYGDPQVNPQPETYWGHVNPIGPRSVYDEAKRFAESLSVAYRQTHRLNIRIARIFNTYGPRMRLDDGRALPTFIGQALRGQPLTVHGEGTQTRSFCYVSDMVDGLLRLFNAGVNDPVNLGNPDEITIRELAELVIELTGSRSTLAFVPRPLDDPGVRRPDITRARALLGWEPAVNLRTGVGETIEWFAARLQPR